MLAIDYSGGTDTGAGAGAGVAGGGWIRDKKLVKLVLRYLAALLLLADTTPPSTSGAVIGIVASVFEILARASW